MKVRFTNHAVRQIDQVLDYIAARSPQREKAVRERMREVVTILSPYPYFLDYRLVASVNELVVFF